MRYIPISPQEQSDMLHILGLEKPEDLFDSIPPDIRLNKLLNTTAAQSEIELISDFEARAKQNSAASRISFLGAGAYSHYSPTVVDSLIQRSEFFTAYTPYQPEIAQGTLQAIFEFQTLICQLTGMDVANASMYDGSTALAEAVLMAGRITGKHKVAISHGVHPEYIEVVRTYVQHAGIDLEIVEIDATTGLTKREHL
ncbi:MAG: glycine dehydrogenase, partial [Pyrinomonadaceae bacterium]